MEIIKTDLRGERLLMEPIFNKGTAFTQVERDQLGLNGLLPPHISTVEEQIKRCYLNFLRKKTALAKYIFLMSLLNRNELLFYQFARRHTKELLPCIYTPTVGEAAVQYSMIYRDRRGVYISYLHRDRLSEMLSNLSQQEVQVIVVTDGERILGLGDQGIGGMSISVGKLSLYTLFGGIHPAKTLPIILDMGTNNQELLENELYLGWKHKRIQGPEYDAFLEEFIQAIQARYPKALIQWEDLGKQNALRVLKTYRERCLSFNDDIQGTGGVALAALFSAIQLTKSQLIAQRIAILGGGSAGLGIASMIIQAMMEEGLSREDALRRIFIVDVKGLIHDRSLLSPDPAQAPFLHPSESLLGWKVESLERISLLEVVENAHPTVLIGVCGQAGAFTEEIVKKMAKKVSRPIVFPLSNPTSKAECTPLQLIEWTQNHAIVATGSPFEPVSYLNRIIKIAQCNNVYLFPALGLGALAAESRQITDRMILQAARILSNFSPSLQDPNASLLPPVEKIRTITREMAIGVAFTAIEDGVSRVAKREIENRVDALRWDPSYPIYQPL